VIHALIQYIQSYLDSDLTPGGAEIFSGHGLHLAGFRWTLRRGNRHELARAKNPRSHASAPRPDARGPARPAPAIADAIKLLLKEDIIPPKPTHSSSGSRRSSSCRGFHRFRRRPLRPTHAITDMNIGILFMLGVSSLSVLGIVTADGLELPLSLIGALRSSAQMVSYEVAWDSQCLGHPDDQPQ